MTNIKELLSHIFNDKATIIAPLIGGMMNESFIVENHGKKYVLYISTPQANEMVDRVLEKENQNLVYQLGITSKNVYFDIDKGIKVNEYIEGSSLDKVNSFDYQKVATLLKTLHNSKTLSKENYEPFKRFINYEKQAQSFNYDFGGDYKLLRDELFVHQQYLEKQPLSLCHNDAQKSNIVKDLKDNYYLIDFEFVGNNDPIYDIATFGNGSVEEGFNLLKEYFKDELDEDKKRRYYLWRIFISLQWHNVAIYKHFTGEGEIHGFNFLNVAKFFLENAKEAYKGLKK